MSALREAMSHAVLGWVKPELDETLRLVRQEIESFVEAPFRPTLLARWLRAHWESPEIPAAYLGIESA